MAISDWSTNPALNATLPGINFAEGMQPDALNNSCRQALADIKTWYDAITASMVSTSTANNWTAAQTFMNSGGVRILDTNNTHGLNLVVGSDLTAERNLTIISGDVARTLDLSLASLVLSVAGAALIDDADAATQRTTLGLGTSAVKDIGTSGNTVPLLDGANSWAAAQTFINSSGIKILDTDASHALGIIVGSNLTAARTFTLTTGDVNRMLDISAANVTITAAGAAILDDVDAAAQRTTLGLGTAATQNTGTSGATVPLLNAANSWGAAQTFINSSGIKILDTDASHALGIIVGSNLTAARTLTLTTGDVNRTLDISAANVTITAAGAAILDDADAAAQRTTLGLGTAATQNTGTSGANVPLLNGNNTHSGTLTITAETTVKEFTETVFTITDAAAFEIDPANGTIQTITLGANRTPKGTNFAAGQSVTLMVDDGTARLLTWTDATFGTTGVNWVGGSAPTLATTGWTVIELWKVGSQVFGSLVGSVAA